jgi:hypothetical protein
MVAHLTALSRHNTLLHNGLSTRPCEQSDWIFRRLPTYAVAGDSILNLATGVASKRSNARGATGICGMRVGDDRETSSTCKESAIANGL